MKVHDEIAKAVAGNPKNDPNAIAMIVADRVTKADLIPLIAAEVGHAKRTVARSTERRAFREAFAASIAKPPRVIPEGLQALFATPFKLGDGEEVNWLHATADQHRQRIGHLSKLRAGIDRTIDQHEEAVTLITGAGVRCLADLTESTGHQAA